MIATRFVSILVAAFLCVPAFAARKIELAPRRKAAPGALAGTWSGAYVQPIHIVGDGSPRTETRKISFTLHLRETANGIEGEVTETNQYGPDRETKPVLRATVVGKVAGTQVTFTKTYETGEGTIEYSGEFDPTKRHLAGIWKRDGESGTFEADLIRPAAVR